MYPDFKELLSAFNAHEVKYLIVGGYAVSLHAQPRATKDLDILVKPEIGNGQAIFNALRTFGAPMEGLTAADFAKPNSFFRMGREPIAVIFCLKYLASTSKPPGQNASARSSILLPVFPLTSFHAMN